MKKTIRYLLFGVSIFIAIGIAFSNLPPYIKWESIFYIIPTLLFLLFLNNVNFKKLAVLAAVALVIGTIWDKIAITLGIWGFPNQSIITWIWGIPIEEYIFFVVVPIFFVVIYLSIHQIHIPHFSIIQKPRFQQHTLKIVIMAAELIVLLFIFMTQQVSYTSWTIIFLGFPVLFFLFRRYEKFDEDRLLLTLLIAVVTTFIFDYVFIINDTWFYTSGALLGYIGIVPIDDLLLAVFITIAAIGLYTSLPSRRIFTGKWDAP